MDTDWTEGTLIFAYLSMVRGSKASFGIYELSICVEIG